MHRAYPNATFVCTTRSIESWMASMIFGNLMAGGLYLPRLYGLTTPYKNTTETRANLTRVYREHSRDECIAVNATRLDLRDGSEALWRKLCSALPSTLPLRHQERCEEKRMARAPWPTTHSFVSAGKRHVNA